MSPFVARITLTEDVGTPLVAFGGTRRPQGNKLRRTVLPEIGPSTPTTFLELVDKSETTREIVKDDYMSGKVMVCGEVAVLFLLLFPRPVSCVCVLTPRRCPCFGLFASAHVCGCGCGCRVCDARPTEKSLWRATWLRRSKSN